ncbi:hypothetical protein CHS0354_026386 [Potamilus streckersoni]|uniref:Uncharacterized protein n=1 Tax=Potamilus streckersoni TaxID=2493646 RepID=A0AAE0T2Y0_9BIVA|nr:hypothetical protein CHS0354_026386 [Potamilus streckersoni]
MTSKENKILIAAIDFGTTYSGYAFSFMAEELTKINAPNMSFGGNMMSLKCPTCVLFNPDGKFHSFGYEAENKYSDLALDEQHQKWYYFERFKMTLHNKQIKRDVEITDDKGLTMPAIKVFGAAIKFLKLHLLATVAKLDSCVTENDVHWVLTVPAIWSDAAKQFMREAAAIERESGRLSTEPQLNVSQNMLEGTLGLFHIPELAKAERREHIVIKEMNLTWVLGSKVTRNRFQSNRSILEAEIDSGSLTIALEPEAASLYCQLLPSDKFSGSGRLTANKYMILDLGGGTADITVHVKQPDGSIGELHEPTGGAWGGTRVDEAFHQMLIKIVGAKIFKQFCDKNKADHVQLLRDLEIKKRAITPELDQRITVQIPVSLASTYQEECGETIEDALEGTPFKSQISWMSGRIRLDASLFRSLFEECTSGLIECVRELLQKPALENVNTFLMVGGFSESPMMQAAIKKAFPNAKVIIPAEAGLVVLKGAVVYGREPMKISSRIAKYTYGINILPAFDTTTHPQEKLVIVGGKERCRDVFKKYIQKGESIKIGEKRSGKHVSLKPDQKEMFLKIYGSAAKDPKFITDPDCEYIGKLVVNLPEKHDIFKVKVDMMFGQTEIKVEAEEETLKEKFASYFDFL